MTASVRPAGFQNIGALIDPFPGDPAVRTAIRNSVTGRMWPVIPWSRRCLHAPAAVSPALAAKPALDGARQIGRDPATIVVARLR